MDDTQPRMRNLFLQLGLDADDAAIASFIRTHQLPAETRVAEAPFWSDAQRQFIGEQWQADAPWAIVIDELNEALHAVAMSTAPGH